MFHFKIIFLILFLLTTKKIFAAPLNNFYIYIINSKNQAKIIFKFHDKPKYVFFYLKNPERIIVDIKHSKLMSIFPLKFTNENLIKYIKSNLSTDRKNIRLIFNLRYKFLVQVLVQYINCRYNVVFFIKKQFKVNKKKDVFKKNSVTSVIENNKLFITSIKKKSSLKRLNKKINITLPIKYNLLLPIVVAIDAGHGGQDPGAISSSGLYEKNITIVIARKLKKLLSYNPIFKPILTRNGDYFVSIANRLKIAHKKKANVFLSIHTNATFNKNVNGVSIWIISKKRVNNEITTRLKLYKKNTKLLDNIGKLLSKFRTDINLSKTILDLQFDFFRRVSYTIGINMLSELHKISNLHKSYPQYANFGVLCSPDIPSVLIEIGFISNKKEEKLLNSNFYQNKIVRSIYYGLCIYFLNLQQNISMLNN